MISATGEMHATAADLNEKRGIQCLEPGGFHSEEIGGQDLLTIMTHQVAPITTRFDPLRRRRDVLALENVGLPRCRGHEKRSFVKLLKRRWTTVAQR